MPNWFLEQSVDLATGCGGAQGWPNALLEYGDDKAHTWAVHVTDGGKNADIAGRSVKLYVARPDGATVVVDGSIDGSTALATFSEACYAIEGQVRAVMRLIAADSVVTLAIADLMVGKSITDKIVDPGTVLPTIDELLEMIERIEKASADAVASEAQRKEAFARLSLTAEPTEGGVVVKAVNVDGTTTQAKLLNGKSAYEVAVENGFKGTEQEWLDSLKAANSLVVDVWKTGLNSYKASATEKEIEDADRAGRLVLAKFDDDEFDTGRQIYYLKNFRPDGAKFYREVIEADKVYRVNLSVDYAGNVTIDKVPYNPTLDAPMAEIIQHFEDDKAGYVLKVIAKDKISQADAREVLTFADQYEGRVIEFLTNGNLPNKAVALGWLMTDAQGNSYLVSVGLDGTITQWNRDSYEKHNFECRSYINEMVDLDNFTIDVQGDAPYMASVQNAFNDPPDAGAHGVVFVLAYSVDRQIQIYLDVDSGKIWRRLITGTADRHTFNGWVEYGSAAFDDTTVSTTKGWTSSKISTEMANNIDTSLTKAGYSADAKAVGDALEGKMDVEGEWELIEKVTTEKDEVFYRDIAPDKKPYNFQALSINMLVNDASKIETKRIIAKAGTTKIYMEFNFVGKNIKASSRMTSNHGFWEIVCLSAVPQAYAMSAVRMHSEFPVPYTHVQAPITQIVSNEIISAKTHIEIWAVRAKKGA